MWTHAASDRWFYSRPHLPCWKVGQASSRREPGRSRGQSQHARQLKRSATEHQAAVERQKQNERQLKRFIAHNLQRFRAWRGKRAILWFMRTVCVRSHVPILFFRHWRREYASPANALLALALTGASAGQIDCPACGEPDGFSTNPPSGKEAVKMMMAEIYRKEREMPVDLRVPERPREGTTTSVPRNDERSATFTTFLTRTSTFLLDTRPCICLCVCVCRRGRKCITNPCWRSCVDTCSGETRGRSKSRVSSSYPKLSIPTNFTQRVHLWDSLSLPRPAICSICFLFERLSFSFPVCALIVCLLHYIYEHISPRQQGWRGRWVKPRDLPGLTASCLTDLFNILNLLQQTHTTHTHTLTNTNTNTRPQVDEREFAFVVRRSLVYTRHPVFC
jgi:hypothetical protein